MTDEQHKLLCKINLWVCTCDFMPGEVIPVELHDILENMFENPMDAHDLSEMLYGIIKTNQYSVVEKPLLNRLRNAYISCTKKKNIK